jgi:hypothetical protein
MIDLLIIVKGILGITLMFGPIVAVSYWWSNGMCNTMGQISETLYMLNEDPKKAEIRIKLETNKLLRELIEKRNLDNEVVECIKRSHKYPMEYLELYLCHESFDNQWFRKLFCLDSDLEYVEIIRKVAIQNGDNHEEKIKQYIDWQERKKNENLSRNSQYLDIYF